MSRISNSEKEKIGPSDQSEQSDQVDKLPLTAHLEELRSRLIKCFIALIIGFGACYGFSDHLMVFVAAPLQGGLAARAAAGAPEGLRGGITLLERRQKRLPPGCRR